MSINPDLRLALLELIHSLEELLTRPLREQQYKPDLGRIAAVANLTLGQARQVIALDDDSRRALEHSTPIWCPPEVLGQRLRVRDQAREQRDSLAPRRPRS